MRITDLLRTIDLFEHLTSDELDQVAHRMRDRPLHADEVLSRQGEPAQAMFIILSGCIELAAGGVDAQPSAPRRLTAGDSFGEVPLISGDLQPATATAVVESRVLELPKDDFEALITTRPQLMRAMLAAVSRRAVQANRRLLTDQSGETSASTNGCIYALFSPRGGSGKTTLAISIATRMAELLPDRVALLDLDLVFDDAALELNLTPELSLAGITQDGLSKLDPRTLSTYLLEHPSSLRALVGATSPEDGERVTAAHVRAALGAMKRQFAVTVVDCGGTFGEPTLTALEVADRVLVVCTPELVTLRDVRECQRVLGQAVHLDKNNLLYVLNHPSPSTGLTRAQFESALEQAMSLEIPHGGQGTSKPAYAKAVEQLVRELRPAESAAYEKPEKKGLLRLWRGRHDR